MAQKQVKKKRYKITLEDESGKGQYITAYRYAASNEALIRELRRTGELEYLLTYDLVD